MCNCNENCNCNKTENGHSECCHFKDAEALLYARMQVSENPEKFILVSAYEISEFDKYLNAARENDKDVTIDLDTADNLPYQLVYGDLMIAKGNTDEVINFVEQMKNHALINLEVEEFGKLTASVYDDICIYKGKGFYEQSMPFVALMKTTCEQQEDISITMFPCCDRPVFINMVERNFLLACRKFVKIDNLTIENWKSHIDEDMLKEAYETAGIYTGEIPELEITDEMWNEFKETVFNDKNIMTSFIGIDSTKLSKQKANQLMDKIREKDTEYCIQWYSELIGFDDPSEQE